MKKHFTRQRAARRRSGFTLVELMVGITLLSLLIMGVMGMFITMLRMTSSVSSSVSTSLDAANTIQRISADLREARRFTLPPGAIYNSQDSGGNLIAVTAIVITAPAARATVTATPNAGPNESLPGVAPGKSFPALWDRADGQTVTFFRANWKQSDGADGTANPNTGKCLWASGTENGQPINGPVIKDIAPALNAVQFIQPYDTNGNPIPNQVKIKLTTAAYDATDGSTSSDSANGSVSQLTGECVYLRDHDTAGVTSSNINANSQD